MKNNGLFSTLFIEEIKALVELDDHGRGRMATLRHAWESREESTSKSLWESVINQAMGYLQFAVRGASAPNLYPLYEDYDYSNLIAYLCIVEPGSSMDDTSVGSFWPGQLIGALKRKNLNWGILTDGGRWRLYSLKTAKPYEDYVELSLADCLEKEEEAEYALFERFFHCNSFVPEISETDENIDEEIEAKKEGVYKCRLDRDGEKSEGILDQKVKKPILDQVSEVLQYICNGFIADTPRQGDEYTEEERNEIFESAVKLLYRCLFLFYAESRRLLPSEDGKLEEYEPRSIRAICGEANKFHWGLRGDTDGYDLWQHLKGLTIAVNEGDPEYGIMGYNGGLFDDEEEKYLGKHRLRNDFLSRALYLLAYVEPYDSDREKEYEIPYRDMEVRHLGELYENILEFAVKLASADRIRRRTKKGVEFLLASETTRKVGDVFIKKGDVYFGETALERKQTGSYYTPESLVRFLNQKAVIQPLREKFDKEYRTRFDSFLKEIREGYEPSTRQGAFRSAVARIERFVNDEVLKFTICDPAMGSGHFLVNASNQITDLIVELLSEIPMAEGTAANLHCRPNYWRRLITRHCLYGVDLNPLAVQLARLSLWLNCFARDHKLTFLDHHLRCGNSLIGIRSLTCLATIPERKKDRKKKVAVQTKFSSYNDLSRILVEASREATSITKIDEDDTDRQKAVFDESRSVSSRLQPLADLYTAYLMDTDIRHDDYQALFECLAKGDSVKNAFNIALPKIMESVENYQRRHHFFHWPLEFPDLFSPDSPGGFLAAVGNPPWDMSSANPEDYFSVYDSGFRKLNRKQSLQRIINICHDNQRISEKWTEYQEYYERQNIYFNEPATYEFTPKGRNNLFQYFLHRSFDVLNDNGWLSLVVPSGLYTDKGCQPLRELFFKHSRINFLYCFENRWPTVFNSVDGRFKFVTFCTQKGGNTDEFKCAFMEHDPERLPAIDANALKMSINQVEKFSPETWSVMEFKNQRDINISDILFKDNPLLGNSKGISWKIKFSIEFMSNTDAWRFGDYNDSEINIYAGRNIFQYDHQFGEFDRSISEDNLLNRYNNKPKLWKEYRIGFRDIAASTNERTCIATVIPPPSACLETARLMYVVLLEEKETANKSNIGNYLIGILNSFCCDYIIRQMVTSHLSQHIMARIPCPRIPCTNRFFTAIASRVLRLISTTAEFNVLWTNGITNTMQSDEFWYPELAPIDNYGPAHEREIRYCLRDKAKLLTPEWGQHCGVHDRMPDRRDTGDRAQLRAEIDAYVAHLYGISRDDFAYILDTFPVLKRKEEKAFGEFMSKRKCLEEYDRIGITLDNADFPGTKE